MSIANSAIDLAEQQARQTAQQIGPLQIAVTRAGTGVYRAPGASFPRPGSWELVLRVQTSEFDRDVTQVDVPVT